MSCESCGIQLEDGSIQPLADDCVQNAEHANTADHSNGASHVDGNLALSGVINLNNLTATGSAIVDPNGYIDIGGTEVRDGRNANIQLGVSGVLDVNHGGTGGILPINHGGTGSTSHVLSKKHGESATFVLAANTNFSHNISFSVPDGMELMAYNAHIDHGANELIDRLEVQFHSGVANGTVTITANGYRNGTQITGAKIVASIIFANTNFIYTYA